MDVTANIDSVAVRPGSTLALTELPGDPGRGVFAGTFDLNATLLFTHQETGRIAELQLRQGFNVAGPWVLADPEGLPSGDNLILLADLWEGRVVGFQVWVPDEKQELCESRFQTRHWDRIEMGPIELVP